jgi:hypothetical protein
MLHFKVLELLSPLIFLHIYLYQRKGREKEADAESNLIRNHLLVWIVLEMVFCKEILTFVVFAERYL